MHIRRLLWTERTTVFCRTGQSGDIHEVQGDWNMRRSLVEQLINQNSSHWKQQQKKQLIFRVTICKCIPFTTHSRLNCILTSNQRQFCLQFILNAFETKTLCSTMTMHCSSDYDLQLNYRPFHFLIWHVVFPCVHQYCITFLLQNQI